MLSGRQLDQWLDTLEAGDATISPEKALEILSSLESSSDPEYAHIIADGALLALLRHLGEKGVVDAFLKIRRWYA